MQIEKTALDGVLILTPKRDVTVKDIPTSDYPTPAVRPLNSRLDCSSLTADFGITPPDWKAGL